MKYGVIHIHPSKLTAERVAAELSAIGWKTAVVPTARQFEVRYFRPEIHGPHHRRGDQS